MRKDNEVANEECQTILTMITIVANVHPPVVQQQALVMSPAAVTDMQTKTAVIDTQTKTIGGMGVAGIHPLHQALQEGITIITIITVSLDHPEEALATAMIEDPGNPGEHHRAHQVEEEDLGLPVAAVTTNLPTLH